MSAQWHARRQPLSLNPLLLHSSSPGSINLAGGTLNIGEPAVPGVTGSQQGVLGVTESPGLSSEQGHSWLSLIVIF